MKIKVALLESDKTYLSRIINAFQLNYSDKLELYSFTSEEAAMKALTELRIDVFLAGDTFAIETERLCLSGGFPRNRINRRKCRDLQIPEGGIDL